MSPWPHLPPGRALPLAAAITGVLLAGTLAGCTTQKAVADDASCSGPGPALTLLTAVHQGAQAPSVPAEWQCLVDKAIRAGVPVSVVSVEGTPQVVLRSYRATLSTANPNATHDDLVAAESTITSAVRTAKATSDGDNLMAALALASDLSAQYGPGGQILVADPGLSDSGVVRFTDPGMSTATGDDIAALVSEHAQCPATMKGTTITFYGLGYGTDPQPRLSVRQRNAVTTGWLAIAKACGASAAAQSGPRTGAGPATTHTTVPVPAEPDPTATPVRTSAPTVSGSCRVELPDVTLGFLPDSDQFVDEANARIAISAAADAIGSCRGHVSVTGTTSSAGTPAGRVAVSGARASRVANLLAVALHQDAHTFTVRGAGFDPAAGCVPDRVNGVLDPTLAQSNRKTVITLSGS